MFAELLPRVGSPRPSVGTLGPGFTLCIVNSGNGLRVFLESTVSPETLSRFYGVKKSGYEELFKVFSGEVWAGEARLKREFDFYHTDIVVADIPGLVNSLENKSGVCVSVSRDPLALYKGKFRVLIPLPEAVLATPSLMCLLDLGRYRRTLLLKLALFIRSSFNMPYSTMGTTRIVWYVYDSKLLPAMIGYTRYYLNIDVISKVSTKVQSKYNLDFLDIVSKAIALSKVYGLGSGRATGFGHTSWEIIGSVDSLTDGGLKVGKLDP